MKKLAVILISIFVGLWIAFAAFLLGKYSPGWLPSAILNLSLPKTSADFGQSFTALEGLLSSAALALGLFAILIQVRQTTDSNIIGAFSVRQQFLLADCERLERDIQNLKTSQKYDQSLFTNMVEKKKRQFSECQKIDKRIQALLDTI